MNPSGGNDTEDRTKQLMMKLNKKSSNEPKMRFISPEEEFEINKRAQRGREKRAHPTPAVADDIAVPESLKHGRTDIRNISTVLHIGSLIQSNNFRVKGPVITPMMVEFFHDYLETNPNIKRIAVIGFNSGYTTETFLTARDDIQVVAFDPIRFPYVNHCARYCSETYKNRFMLVGGIVKCSIEMFASYFGNKRFDMIYIDSGSYPTTAGDDLTSSRFLAHAKTVVFMENVRPYSGTGSEVFKAWNSYVERGELRETADPRTWENLNRCLCEGIFVSGASVKPLREGEMSRVKHFWETDPVAVLWKYGNELKEATPERAMELWEEMTKKGITHDETAFNMYISALRKAPDRKYQQEIERVQRLFRKE